MSDQAAVAAPSEEIQDAIAEKTFGFWIYLMSDAIIFALLFATYVVMSHNFAGGPGPKSLFNLSHTFGETMLLLTSSITFGFTSIALEAGKRRPALAWLCVTFLLGLGFVAMELSEFHGMIAQGAGPTRSGFLSAFFTLVGTHGLHVSVGLIWIVLLGLELAVRGLTPHVASRLHRLGLFWHFLDIIWIGIFSVVYLSGVI